MVMLEGMCGQTKWWLMLKVLGLLGAALGCHTTAPSPVMVLRDGVEVSMSNNGWDWLCLMGVGRQGRQDNGWFNRRCLLALLGAHHCCCCFSRVVSAGAQAVELTLHWCCTVVARAVELTLQHYLLLLLA